MILEHGIQANRTNWQQRNIYRVQYTLLHYLLYVCKNLRKVSQQNSKNNNSVDRPWSFQSWKKFYTKAKNNAASQSGTVKEWWDVSRWLLTESCILTHCASMGYKQTRQTDNNKTSTAYSTHYYIICYMYWNCKVVMRHTNWESHFNTLHNTYCCVIWWLILEHGIRNVTG